MEKLTVTGFLWDAQWEMPLDGMTSLEITKGMDSPVSSLRASFAVEQMPEDFSSIQVLYGDTPLFDGLVDAQRCSISKDGISLVMEARTKEAVLLDNEAKPGELSKPTLATLSSRCAVPYGFSLTRQGGNGSLPFYNIPRGCSEWEAMAGFARLAFGEGLYMSQNRIMVGDPSPQHFLTLSNSGYGMNYLELERENRYCKVLSDVYIRDNSGNYATRVTNQYNPGNLANRKRYMLPDSDYTMSPRWSAAQKIRYSMREKEIVTATLPGIVEVEPGDQAQVMDTTAYLVNLVVDEVVLSISPRGLTTKITMVNALFA